MRNLKNAILFPLALLGLFQPAFSQIPCEFNLSSGLWEAPDGSICPNAVSTAVPFLLITPDSRSGALGNAGVALDGSPYSMHHNPSALGFTEKNFDLGLSYTPWLRGLTNDVFLAHLAGYYKPDRIQAFGVALKYFNMGDVEFRDENAASLGTGYPREWEVAASYSRLLSDNFSMSVTGKFIYSNLASGQTIGTNEITSGTAFGVDIGMQYQEEIQPGQTLIAGLALTNLGTKISYTERSIGDFIPGNLSLGASYKFELDDYNTLSLIGQANKLLVPSPSIQGDTTAINPDTGEPFWREQSLFSSIFNSFSDAPNGFREEMQEINWTLAAEYWYNDIFAVRMGYFNEHVNKGNRKFLTFGFGFNYNGLGLDMSYLVSTTTRPSPLANTVRISLRFSEGILMGDQVGT